VLISRVERPNAPSASMSGTVLALIARGAVGERVYEYRAGNGPPNIATSRIPLRTAPPTRPA
jgi:hypothetical protein